jgi:hypothetical protein
MNSPVGQQLVSKGLDLVGGMFSGDAKKPDIKK